MRVDSIVCGHLGCQGTPSTLSSRGRLTFHGLVAIFAIDWIVSYLLGFLPRQ